MSAFEMWDQQSAIVCIRQVVYHVASVWVSVGLDTEAEVPWKIVDRIDERHLESDLIRPGGLVHKDACNGDLTSCFSFSGIYCCLNFTHI